MSVRRTDRHRIRAACWSRLLGLLGLLLVAACGPLGVDPAPAAIGRPGPGARPPSAVAAAAKTHPAGVAPDPVTGLHVSPPAARLVRAVGPSDVGAPAAQAAARLSPGLAGAADRHAGGSGLHALALPAPTPRPAGSALGRIDAATQERLRHVWAAGQALGRRAAVFAKVGDSITASGSFLSDAGDGNAVLGTHRELAPILAYYRAAVVDRLGGVAHNALNRHSLAARAGWTGAQILGLRGAPAGAGPAPLAQEYAALDPAVALIMFGTNDLDVTGVDFFSSNLAALVDVTLQAGIIPVLSTIPDRLDSPQAAARTRPYNDAIRDLAALEHIPIIEYWGALQGLPQHGLGPDLVHPSIYPGRARSGAVTFTVRGLTYGWNLRNYLTLAMLAKLQTLVARDGPPDP